MTDTEQAVADLLSELKQADGGGWPECQCTTCLTLACVGDKLVAAVRADTKAKDRKAVLAVALYDASGEYRDGMESAINLAVEAIRNA